MAEPEGKQDDPPPPSITLESASSTSTSPIPGTSTEQDEDKFPGTFAKDYGLSISQLMNLESAQVAVMNYQTGLVLELYDFCSNKKDTANMLFTLAHANNAIHHSKFDSVRLKIGDAVQKRKTLKRNKKAALLAAFLQANFVPPIPATQPSTSTATPSESVQKRGSEEMEDDIALKEEVHNVEEQLRKESEKADKLSGKLKQLITDQRDVIASYSKDMKAMNAEMKKITRAYDIKSDKLDKANAKVETLKEKHASSKRSLKNLGKRLKRGTEKFEKETQYVRELEETTKELQMETEDIREVLVAAKKEKKCALKSLGQVKRRAERRRHDAVRMNEAEIKELKNTVKINNARIAELQQLNILLDDEVINTFEGGRYVNELRQTMMTLLTECNVSMSKVSRVIQTVCQNLIGKLPERLPSLETLDRILSEAKFVVQNQIYQCMKEGGDTTSLTGNTLHNDATTKFHHHYQEFQVTLLDGKQMTIGLGEVGASDTTQGTYGCIQVHS